MNFAPSFIEVATDKTASHHGRLIAMPPIHALTALATPSHPDQSNNAVVALPSMAEPIALHNAAQPPSSIVTLSATSQTGDALTYSLPAVSRSNAPWWEQEGGEVVSDLMAANFTKGGVAGGFAGLGAALLARLGSSADDFSQSVMLPATDAQFGEQTDAVNRANQADLHGSAANQITLALTLRSGAKVSVVLGYQANGMAVQLKSSEALSDAERTAVAKLAKGFQAAIDGLSAASPSLDLAGLTHFDPSVVTSLALDAQIQQGGGGVFALKFDTDSKQRSLKVSGPGGKLAMKLDMANAAVWGNQAQRGKAVAAYLQRFDLAAKSGHADPALMTMFKDGFSQLNDSYAAEDDAVSPSVIRLTPLADQDHAILTGLADFQVSVDQTPSAPNPMLRSEVDHFSYQASQQSQIFGRDNADRAINQQLHTSLSASYHEPLVPGTALRLGTDKASQNYRYYQIEGETHSSASIRYADNVMIAASLSRSAKQTREVSKYEQGARVEHSVTPQHYELIQDLLATLKPLHRSRQQAAGDGQNREQAIAKVHDLVLAPSPAGFVL